MASTRLLINEPPLQVLPSLATAIGLNEAIFLQQVHYWLNGSTHVHDGRRWIYNSYAAWHKQFPFWSVRTIQRIVGSLVDQGILITGNYNTHAMDKTTWYSIDYDRLDIVEAASDETVSSSDETETSSGQVVHMAATTCPHPDGQPVHMLIEQETTQETTTERTVDDGDDGLDGLQTTTPPDKMSPPLNESASSSAFGALWKLGVTKGQCAAILKKNRDLTVEHVAAWQAWLATCKADNPIAIMIKHLMDGRRVPPVVASSASKAVASSMPDPSDQAAFRAYLNGAR